MGRVLFLAPAASTRGGFESVLCRLCRSLPGHGWDAVLGLARGARFHDPARFLAENGPLKAIEIDGTRGTFHARRAALEMAIRETSPDIVVGARLFDAIPAINSLRESGRPMPLVQMIGSWDADLFSDLRRYRGIIDFCVVDSRLPGLAVADHCGYPPARVVRIPTGIAQPGTFKRPPRTEELRLCYVGRLDDSDKRACDLVPFVQELSRRKINFQLTVAGDGCNRLEIEARLQNEIACRRVRFTGWLDADSLHALLLDQDVLVQFSPSEGLTISPREGLVRGVVPVLSEFIGFFTEGLFQPGWNCLSFPVGQPAIAAEHIQRLAADHGLLERLSDCAIHSQEEEYLSPADLEAWATFLSRAAEVSPSAGLQDARFPEDSGRLSRLPRGLQHFLRAYSRHEHDSAGGEWPHTSGWASEDEHREFEEFARAQESRCRPTASHIVN